MPVAREYCATPVDLAFVVDSSGSINRTTFKREKHLVEVISKRLGISPTHGRAAIVLYSGNASIEAGFDTYTSEKDFVAAVGNLPYLSGGTSIDKALDLAHNQVFSQARDGVAKVAVVLTDARQDRSATGLKDASAALRNQGVRVLAVGMGDDVDRNELKSLVKSKDDALFTTEFDNLNLRLREIRNEICGKDKLC